MLVIFRFPKRVVTVEITTLKHLIIRGGGNSVFGGHKVVPGGVNCVIVCTAVIDIDY